jgi:hypothetical protein
MRPTYYEKILGVLVELKETHPKCSMGRHLATALEPNTWNMTDAEVFVALQKYKSRLSMDVFHPDSDIDKIINDGIHLSTILQEDEEDDD